MRSDLDHLPQVQQRELTYVTNLLLDGFEKATASCSQAWRRNGKVQKIILFGSYARNDWVDEPENGYQSDYDLLIIVSHPDLTDIADYWYEIEERILRSPKVRRLVNIIVHTLDEVNRSLTRGEYFWTDVARDGIVLHDMPGHPLAAPQPLTQADALIMAQEYCEFWLRQTDAAIKLAAYAISEHENRDAAFLLHQATERAFTCYLLVTTFYVPRSHNIKFLRSLVEDREPRLIPVWPRVGRADRRRFAVLKRAYVEARYSEHFDISLADLEILMAWVGGLRDEVEALCRERIELLASKVAGASLPAGDP
jgi:uncharacterized protein